MAQVFTVTASTSVVLISSLQAPNTVVLLSSIRYPGHIVGVRDITGSNDIALYPVIVSTMSGLKFYDNTSSIVLNQPNGFLSLSSRDTSTWQLLNSVGFLTSLSNAFLEQLTSQTSYARITSTLQETVSTLVTGRLTVLNSIQVQGNTDIQGDITLGGSLDVFSTLRAFQSMFLSSSLTVGGNVTFPSSLTVRDGLSVGSTLSTVQTLTVRDALQIQGSLAVAGALLPPFLSVQTLAATTFQAGGGLQVYGGISTTNMSVGQDAVFLGNALFQDATTVLGRTAIADELTGLQGLQTGSLQAVGAAAAFTDSYAGTLRVSGAFSTLSSVVVDNRFVASGETRSQDQVNSVSSAVRSLEVFGNALISSLSVFSTLQSQGTAQTYSSTFLVTSQLQVQGDLRIGQTLSAPQAYLRIDQTLSTQGNLVVAQNFVANGTTTVLGQTQVTTLMEQASSMRVNKTVSSANLFVEDQLFVLGNVTVGGLASASTLGAPISLQISTLSLSNTLTVQSYGTMPELQTNAYPDKFLVGDVTDNSNYDLYVGGILQNRSTVLQQASYASDYRRWVAQDLYVSTFAGQLNLSSMLIGKPDFIYPLIQVNGFLLLGAGGGLNQGYIYSASNYSTTYATTQSFFSQQARKVRYGGSNLWVAVGLGASASDSIKVSPNGYTWTNAASGGFGSGGKDVVFGASNWVAVGYSPSGNATIQYSGNALQWSNCTGFVFPTGGGTGGESVAYNGSNLFVAAGVDSTRFGLRYSSDGINWTTGTTLFGPAPILSFGTVAFGNGRWLACPTGTAFNTLWTSLNGSNWFQIGGPGQNFRKFLYLSNMGAWIGGADATASQQITSIQISPTNGSNWINITQGGFTGACYDLLYVPDVNTLIAVGSNVDPLTCNYQYSANLSSFANVATQTFSGAAFGIGYGPISLQNAQSFFTANLTSIFRSTLSSATLIASTVNASSFSGTYFADGSLLTRVGEYTSSISTGVLTAQLIRAHEVSTGLFFGNYARAADSIFINRQTFLSTANIYLAAGSDSLSNGNIQSSENATAWTRSLDSNFEYYGNDIFGNSNIANPFYVAAGADSRTAYTLLWSQNGRVWSPAVSGGFTYATSAGIREATSVTYSQNLSRWVALGRDTGGTNTIQYSSDGKNWTVATGGFNDFGTKVKASPNGFVAIGNEIKWSANGISWTTSGTAITLTAIGYGTFTQGPTFTQTGWMGIAVNSVYYSLTEGASWQALGVFVGALTVTDVLYANSIWVAVGDNQIFRSTDGFNWTAVSTGFPAEVRFKSISYNTNSGVWLAGGQAVNNTQTVYQSGNSITWSQASSGGFSTSVETYGGGYGVCALGFSTVAVGVSALDVNLPVRTSILNISTLDGSPSTTITGLSLTPANASSIFSTVIRAIAAEPTELYKFVAVGDGFTPQKTIARSVDGTPGSWLPAVAGGFVSTGYGVTYYKDRWIAVGDALASTNYIQYSPDGASWFGTNTSTGMSQGGRGITVGFSTAMNTVLAVGKDDASKTIVYSTDGYNWQVADPTTTFNVQGNAVASGTSEPPLPFGVPPYGIQHVAVGQDTRGSNYTVLTSQTGSTWSPLAGIGGFTTAGYGVAWAPDKKMWVLVGEDSDANQTIQYSLTGGYSFLGAANGFTKGGYAVAYNSSLSTFFAVGQDLAGNSEMTIKTSPDGVNWFNISSPSGFISQKNLGVANGVFTQPVLTQETVPYMDFSNLIVYERETPTLYTVPTIRLQSSFVAFNETLFVNLSSQVIIGSNVPLNNADVTVYGDVYVPQFIHPSPTVIPNIISVSTMTVSTLSSTRRFATSNLITPSFEINASQFPRANSISTVGWSASGANTVEYGQLTINETLYVYNLPSSIQFPQKVGINASNAPGTNIPTGAGFPEVLVGGSFGASTLLTQHLVTQCNVLLAAPDVFYEDQYLSMFESSNDSLVTSGNRIQVNASSMTLNSILTLQVSTQRIGLYTRNPQFDLDVQCQTVLSNLKVSTLNTSLLFLTLQSV